jgi:hypothetical protein
VGSLFSAPSTDPGLHRRVELVEAHGDAVAAHGVHGLDEDRVAHHAHLHALQVRGLGHRLVRIDVARARVHPAQRDEARLRIAADLLEQLRSDRAVDHLAHVLLVAKDERQVEDIELVDHRAHGAHGDARDLQRPHLGLLDHLLLASELHRGVHLDRDPAVGGRFELLAHALDGLDRRIAERMDVARLPHHFLLRQGGRRTRADGHHERDGGRADKLTTLHGFLLLWLLKVRFFGHHTFTALPM